MEVKEPILLRAPILVGPGYGGMGIDNRSGADFNSDRE